MEKKYESVVYLVEASSFERFTLWKNHSHESKKADNPVQWEQINSGDSLALSSSNANITTYVELWRAILNGKMILFFWPTSMLVDWGRLDSWLTEEFPNIPRCNAENFHNCLSVINKPPFTGTNKQP